MELGLNFARQMAVADKRNLTFHSASASNRSTEEQGEDSMKQPVTPLAVVLASALLAVASLAEAQTAAAISPSISTAAQVDSRIGTLEFRDGAPSQATLDKVYDNLDYTHAFEAFVNTMQGVNAAAIRKGFLDIGV